jgi:hypothetical protein
VASGHVPGSIVPGRVVPVRAGPAPVCEPGHGRPLAT